MAHTIQFFTSSSYKNLPIVSGGALFNAGELVTASPSGATGIILDRVAARLTVLKLSGTFASGDVVTAVISGTNATMNGAEAAPTTTRTSLNSVIVTGIDAGVTDIFRYVADYIVINHSGTGVTSPTLSNQWLVLDMNIFIGTQAQGAATKVVSQNESIDLEAATKCSIYVNGNATYKTTFQIGYAKYKDDLLSNFPPIQVSSGSKLKLDALLKTQQFKSPIVSDLDSTLEFYRASLQCDNVGVSCNPINLYGIGYFYDCNFLDSAMQNYFVSTSTWYMENCYFQNYTGYTLITGSSPAYMKRVFFINCAYAIYSFGIPWESILTGVFIYDENGELATYLGAVFGNGGLDSQENTLHLIDSDANIDTVSATVNFNIYSLKEHGVKFTVVDENGAVIPDANIELRDNYGKALWTPLTAKLTVGLGSTDTTIALTSNAEFPDYGSTPVTIRIATERMFATKASSGATDIVVSRGVEGTFALDLYTNISIIWKSEVAITDSFGKAEYLGITKGAVCSKTAHMIFGSTLVTIINGSPANPFTLKVWKDGYSTEKLRIVMTGFGTYNIVVRLRHSPTPGRDEMGLSII